MTRLAIAIDLSRCTGLQHMRHGVQDAEQRTYGHDMESRAQRKICGVLEVGVQGETVS